MKRFFLFLALILMSALPLTAHAADATSFDPTLVKVTAKPISSIPVGTIISWPVAQNPADWQNPDGSYNWLECNGQNFSQAAYPELFALLGGRVPDLRGLFLRGHGGNSAALGVTQGDAIRNIRGTIAGYNGGIRAMDGAFVQGWSEYATSAGNNFNIPSGVYFDASRVVPTSEENRPVNVAVRYLVRSRP